VSDVSIARSKLVAMEVTPLCKNREFSSRFIACREGAPPRAPRIARIAVAQVMEGQKPYREGGQAAIPPQEKDRLGYTSA
jgi:hypothetical protein